VVAHAFNPIDLMPDPIPVLEYLHDLVIIPLAIGMIPPQILAGRREEAPDAKDRPVAVMVVVAVWLVALAF
jgi:uncharacterized membrane protein YkvA (DUF1232 family)